MDNVCASGIGGGGILWEQSAGVIKDCHFERNYSALGAGAIHMYRMDGSEVERCTFIANVTRSAPFGSAGAIQASTGSVTIRESVFTDNDADAGASALFVDDGHAIVQLCTFVRNKGFFCISAWNESIQVENCIVAFNQGASFECPAAASLSCNDIFGNADGDWLECIVGDLGINGNVSADPLFCDVEESDWRLNSESPCAPEHSGGCGLIGALVEGCGPEPIVDSSWGTIKLRFVERK